ncbi:MAG TPA: 50S ribosomal protein L4 [Acidimicrobiales bacterium]|nr:50S ribosomal protein L4 [Acidimicrobiales bacterium]
MAITVDVRTVSGESSGSVELDEAIFGIQPNVPVMHQVVTAQLAAARAGTQSTKTRAEVSGGGKKPFRQKGTGRARQGSERAPHFAGGGVALGPKPRSYKQRTPRKMVQLALRSALSDRAAEGKIAVVGSWPWEAPSTRDARAALEALGLEGKVLVVLSRSDHEAYKSFRNLPHVQILLDAELNSYDVLCNDWIVFTSETLPGGPGNPGEGGDTGEADGSSSAPAAKAVDGPKAETDDAQAAAAVAGGPGEPAASTEATEESDDE